MSSPKIFWLASYPKSGNTWLRILLSNLLADKDSPVNINKMETHGIASAKSIFEQEMGVGSDELSRNEIDLVRPDIYCSHAKKQKSDLYLKVHDAYQYNQNQQPLFPSHCSTGVIYIVRNPLDVTVSLANHLGVSLEKSIRLLNNKNYRFCKKTDRGHDQLEQYLGDWSNHVQSWQQNNVPVHLVRYEDMLENTEMAFQKIVDFIGLDYNKEQVAKAVRFSSIKELQKQEEKHDFNERPSKAKRFFRKGISGDGKHQLSEELQKRLTDTHRKTMTQLGYL